jgi:hypothetical protein
MVEKLRSEVRVPVWIISLVIPILLSILFAVGASIKTNAQNMGSVNTSIGEINKRLDRLETKIDRYVEK